MKEATVVMARCGDPRHNKAPYGITMVKEGGGWICVWAFALRESAAKKEGFDKQTVKGEIDIAGEFPGCPYCGAPGFVQCGGDCRKISCYSSGRESHVCPHCGDKMDNITEGGDFEIASGAR